MYDPNFYQPSITKETFDLATRLIENRAIWIQEAARIDRIPQAEFYREQGRQMLRDLLSGYSSVSTTQTQVNLTALIYFVMDRHIVLPEIPEDLKNSFDDRLKDASFSGNLYREIAQHDVYAHRAIRSAHYWFADSDKEKVRNKGIQVYSLLRGAAFRRQVPDFIF